MYFIFIHDSMYCLILRNKHDNNNTADAILKTYSSDAR